MVPLCHCPAALLATTMSAPSWWRACLQSPGCLARSRSSRSRCSATFADQAAIAIENARLAAELRLGTRPSARRWRSRPRPARSCGDQRLADRHPAGDRRHRPERGPALPGANATSSGRGRPVRLVAMQLTSRSLDDRRAGAAAWPCLSGRAILERRIIEIPDLLADPRRVPEAARRAARGLRTSWACRCCARACRSAHMIRRTEVRPFTDAQVALLKTFADQAVIAIENARCSSSSRPATPSSREALEQQTATAEILNVISRSPTDVQPVLDAIAESTRVCGGDCLVHGIDGDEHSVVAAQFSLDAFRRAAADSIHARLGDRPRRGRAADDRHGRPPAADPRHADPQSAVQSGRRTAVATPLLRERNVIGVLRRGGPRSVRSRPRRSRCSRRSPPRRSLPSRTSACSTELRRATAISRMRSRNRRRRGHSQRHQPVADRRAAGAGRHRRERGARVPRRGLPRPPGAGQRSAVAAHYCLDDWGRRASPFPIARGSVSGRAALERRRPSTSPTSPPPTPSSRSGARGRRLPRRTSLGVPLLREGEVIGVAHAARRGASRSPRSRSRCSRPSPTRR